MAEFVKLNPAELKQLHTVDQRLMSYNVEMTEITGGTFWKEYTPAQIAGTEPFLFDGNFGDGFTAMASLMQYYPPINLYDERLRALSKELGSTWVRVSGSWATKTYYDLDGKMEGKVPEGFQATLTKEQWIGVLDFVKAIDGKLLISVGNCAGNHPNGGPIDLSQTEMIFNFSHEYGVDIDAFEFMNEPNMLEMSGAPHGYTPADFVRDQDLANGWVREHYPNCLIVGPCTCDGMMGTNVDEAKEKNPMEQMGAGLGNVMQSCSTADLMNGAQVKLDVYSYHYYNGISERIAPMMPQGHWLPETAHTEPYLAVAPDLAARHTQNRDKYVPGGQMWVTESGDAGGGGDTWASTYLDVLRTLNELGGFAKVTDGVIFHNTLASSDYGFLKHGSFEPRPNYFAVLLWNRLMGSTVYDAGIPVTEGAHVYCHSRKDGKEGCVYLIINNSLTESTTVELPSTALRYTLTGEHDMRSSVMSLNGKALTISGVAELPDLSGEQWPAGKVELVPGSCSFFVL